MGRHAVPELEAPTVRLNLRVQQVQGERKGGWGAWPRYQLVAVVVVGALVVLIGLGSWVNSIVSAASRSDSSRSSSSAAQTVPYWQSQPADSWWYDARGEFTQRFEYYEQLSGRTYMQNQYQLGMEWCRAMRAGQTADISNMVANEPVPGQTWATVNTAIDIYCPDQEAYRHLVASP